MHNATGVPFRRELAPQAIFASARGANRCRLIAGAAAQSPLRTAVRTPHGSDPRKRRWHLALRHEGEYSYGDGPADIWEYFVWYTRNSVEPVKHWRQAMCRCGGATFNVAGNEECGQYQRTYTSCDDEFIFFANEWTKPKQLRTDIPIMECICFGEEFEVVGVTAPSGNPNSAWWFYLGMRCVECGCLGCYADWTPRYNDAVAYLDML